MAGETAQVILHHGCERGASARPGSAFDNPMPAPPYCSHSRATRHQAVNEIPHVQSGMVLMHLARVLVLSVTVVVPGERIARNLKGQVLMAQDRGMQTDEQAEQMGYIPCWTIT